MKTEISKFCDASLQHLTPLSPALERAAADLEQGSEKGLIERPLAALNDIRARLRSLMEKLASQQAYLLIFGPLKSGKSTLMNAISGAYVSEVTSLPGYPCLVFVRNAEQPHFSVTRYNGRETVFANGSVLKDVIEDSHVALAEQIRATELRGDDFDPRTHFTEAIRRVDVKLPVRSLAESSTVLVDTPGLYSRMNFGYDVLTREFRDSAACAVFVVKTDNLFLEQVFTEFNQLLGLFSRIFLVINVDSSKRDLHADGSLQPSAESRDPEQIIEAFKTLSMAGPLRKAYEEKRVRIHAVDLLNAASSFLSGETSGNGHNGGNGHGNGGVITADATAAQKKAFDAFLRDLTDYLNSSDYTVEFIRDSMRQGQTLCAETREIFASDEILGLRAKQNSLENELRDLEERVAAVDRLLAVDWDAAFQKVREENAARGKQSVTAKAARVSKEMNDALDRWFETGESVQTLVQKHWDPLLAAAAHALSDDTRSRLMALLGPPLGGAEPPALVMNDLHTVGFSLVPIAEEAASELKLQEPLAPYALSVPIDQIPVRKKFVDWILFRKAAAVRRRVLGEDLAQELPPEVKAERLPETSREALRKVIGDSVQARFPALPEKFAAGLLSGYVAKFISELLRGLRELRERLSQERLEQQAPVEANRRLFESQQELHETATRVSETFYQLAQEESMVLPRATLDEAIEAVAARAPGTAEDPEPMREYISSSPGETASHPTG